MLSCVTFSLMIFNKTSSCYHIINDLSIIITILSIKIHFLHLSINTLGKMNVSEIFKYGYIPNYTRTELTDVLHNNAGLYIKAANAVTVCICGNFNFNNVIIISHHLSISAIRCFFHYQQLVQNLHKLNLHLILPL